MSIRMRRAAFTLMELLIVITIIVLLMGMVMGGVMYTRKAAAQAKTRGKISEIAGALQTYRTVSGRFPDDPAKFSQLTSNPLSTAISPGDWRDINQALATILKDAGEPVASTLEDAWKQPLLYRPARFLPFDSTAPRLIDKDDPPGRDSFQLWSTGANKTDQGGAAGSDDVTSWAQ
jgi:prepilin-type N-terminal cleavage/methylation domain-containing protein